MLIAKKKFLSHALDRKKAGPKRVRIAKNIYSSLLERIIFTQKQEVGYREKFGYPVDGPMPGLKPIS
jgi:hypothetical protein